MLPSGLSRRLGGHEPEQLISSPPTFTNVVAPLASAFVDGATIEIVVHRSTDVPAGNSVSARSYHQ